MANEVKLPRLGQGMESGVVRKWLKSEGDSVAKGQRLVTLEAMKMEHGLTAPFDGIVAELNAEAGAQVAEGTLLVRVEKAE